MILDRTPRMIRLSGAFDNRRILRAISAVLRRGGHALQDDCKDCCRGIGRRRWPRLRRLQGRYHCLVEQASRKDRGVSATEENRLARPGHQQGKTELVLSR